MGYRLAETDAGDCVRGYLLSLLETDVANRPPSKSVDGRHLSGRIELVAPRRP
jgi:hypothetical protein